MASCLKFTDGKPYLRRESKHAMPRVLCLESTPEQIAGKLVDGSLYNKALTETKLQGLSYSYIANHIIYKGFV